MPSTIASAMPRKKYGESSFGKRLAALRKARGMTQIQLAKTAATTQPAISYYENEAGFPPAPAVMDLARALHVTTDELLGIKPQPRELSKFEQLYSDPESRRLWKRFQQMAELPEKDQRAVIRLINSLSTVRASEARA